MQIVVEEKRKLRLRKIKKTNMKKQGSMCLGQGLGRILVRHILFEFESFEKENGELDNVT